MGNEIIMSPNTNKRVAFWIILGTGVLLLIGVSCFSLILQKRRKFRKLIET